MSWLGIVVCISLPAALHAQQPGSYYYAVENLTSGQILRRDVATSEGIPRGGLILQANNLYRHWLLDGGNLQVGMVEFVVPNGVNFSIPSIPLRTPLTPDTDGDGLHDDAEFIIGTDPAVADTDADGLDDGDEFNLGLDPLDGDPGRIGILASGDTPGFAADVSAFNDVAILADSNRGVSVFNIFNGMFPVIIAQVDTPGEALAVDHSGPLIAVADGSAGLAIIDFEDPAAAEILHQIPLAGAARAVATVAGVAYVGTHNGRLVQVDMVSGTPLSELFFPAEAVHDLMLVGDFLYALVGGSLHAISFSDGVMSITGTVASPGSPVPGGRIRLFAGADTAYAAHSAGLNRFDLANPSLPVLSANLAPGGVWRHLVENGTGAGLAAVDGNLSMVQLDQAGGTNFFAATVATPGNAFAVSLYNGIA
ncbi:MAG: hypothetical protein AAF492_04855, partial [Verrucomicrobiota bacterium]